MPKLLPFASASNGQAVSNCAGARARSLRDNEELARQWQQQQQRRFYYRSKQSGFDASKPIKAVWDRT